MLPRPPPPPLRPRARHSPPTSPLVNDGDSPSAPAAATSAQSPSAMSPSRSRSRSHSTSANTTPTPTPKDPSLHRATAVAPLYFDQNDLSNAQPSSRSSPDSLAWTESGAESDAPSTPADVHLGQSAIEAESKTQSTPGTLNQEHLQRRLADLRPFDKALAAPRPLASNANNIDRLLGGSENGTRVIEKYCCGGGCCMALPNSPVRVDTPRRSVDKPDNDAFKALKLRLGRLKFANELTNVAPLPTNNITFEKLGSTVSKQNTDRSPPGFMKPHPPYDIFSAPVHHARELTKPGAVKRTFHIELDITNYPEEGGVDFKVGGAIGVCPANPPEMVDDVLDRLGVPRLLRDKLVRLKTGGGRWPTIWGDDQARELVTTRRELLTWCTDLQSSPPTKQLLRLLAEHATVESERDILLYLVSAQGQGDFCELRTGPHVTVPQLLHAFPSTHPPLEALLSVLPQLMPRFYSLSNDVCISDSRHGLPGGRRLIEMAISVHEEADWRDGGRARRPGVGSGFLERVAQRFIAVERATGSPAAARALDLTVPMFRGLMANPLSREFQTDGPMLLIGAGVGIAPFRGFIKKRLKNANCANKIWLIQGVRDAAIDELYQGEIAERETEFKTVVQSRARVPPPNTADGKVARYVQDEVRTQADVVWYVVNSVDGRVFVCGARKMGLGVEQALIDVAVSKGNLNRDEAERFWAQKKESKQYISETL